MGYYTSYNLYVKNVRSREEHDALVQALKDREIWGHALHDSWYHEYDHGSEFSNCDCAKWYEHDEDMIAISKQFPHMTFQLWGTGEEEDDRWYCMYKDGDSEEIRAEIVWPKPERIKWE